MKRTLIIAAAVLMSVLAFAQPAKKPSLMVVPSRVWCNQNGFMMDFDGTKIPDYQRAFDESQELNIVVSKIGQMMTDRGFDLKMMQAALQTVAKNAAEDMLLTSKSGADVVESPIDKLRKTAKADIWMEVNWVVNNGGFSYTLTFDLSGVDAYTDKQIANCQGTSEPAYTAELPVLLGSAVSKYIDNFNEQLQSKFDDWFDNGREISLTIKTWGDWEYDLESEDFGDDELGVLIENWVSENTVAGQFTTDDATESYMLFSNVKIPMFDANGKAVDARGWGRGLNKMLKAKGIESKVMTKGLGSVTLVLGGK